MHAYLFFGPPGSGKGTQSKLVGKMLTVRDTSWILIETGQLLRKSVSSGDTPVKRMLSTVMAEGGLVPSVFPVAMWVNTLLACEESLDHIVIDGAGRKPAEAKLIVEMLLFFQHMRILVFFIDIPDDEVLARLLKRGRSDDDEAVIRHRLEVYRDDEDGTFASINFLRHCPDVSFHLIDGVGTVDAVHQRILPYIGV